MTQVDDNAKGRKVLCGFAATDANPEILFYDEYPADCIPDAMASTENEKKAWSVMSGIKIGLEVNAKNLTYNHLLVLEQSLFSRFSELGVPMGVIMPLIATFRYVQDAKTGRSPVKQAPECLKSLYGVSQQ